MLSRNWKSIGTVSLAAILMSGCSIAAGLTKQEQAIVDDLAVSQYQPASRETRNNIETQDNFAQAAFWSREYQLNPADLEAAIKLSAAVRKMGNPGKAVEISQTARAMYPRDPYLLAEYAAALIASERGDEAIEAIDSGLRTAPGYGRLWSLKGAALDQQENYDLARKHYARALQITPQDPNVMSNLGLSYALAGDAATAETWMRRAAAQPGAGANIHQNLDLIMQLQGKSTQGKTSQGKHASNQMPATRTPPLRAAMPSSQPKTYGQAVQSRKPRTQARANAPQIRSATQKSAMVQRPSQSQGQFGHRSNVTVVGGQNGAKSASDMARAAAAQSKRQGKKITMPAGQAPHAAPSNILSRLSNNVGPRRMNTPVQAQRPEQEPQMQAQAQTYPTSNYQYPQPNQPQYNAPVRRGAARRR